MSENPDIVTVYGEEIEVAGLSDWLAHLKEYGYVLIPNWISKERGTKLREDLIRDVNPIREVMGDGGTVRAHNLLAKTRCVDDLVCDRRLIAIAQGLLGPLVQVSVVAMFDLLAGAKAQPLHQDDGLWPIARPHPPIVMNAVLAVDDFRLENGATHLVPGSHSWHDQPVRQPPDVETVQVEMKAGSLVIWDGAMWHGGGANRTQESRLALDLNYNAAWLRQQENQYIGIPREEVRKMPERLQRLVGYQHGMSVAGAGMVDLRDPLEMVDKVSFGYDINDPGMPRIG
jgi:ectoine hydroxylase-related dioxygenase (phytanoyl-CoA dioxygenase family)